MAVFQRTVSLPGHGLQCFFVKGRLSFLDFKSLTFFDVTRSFFQIDQFRFSLGKNVWHGTDSDPRDAIFKFQISNSIFQVPDSKFQKFLIMAKRHEQPAEGCDSRKLDSKFQISESAFQISDSNFCKYVNKAA